MIRALQVMIQRQRRTTYSTSVRSSLLDRRENLLMTDADHQAIRMVAIGETCPGDIFYPKIC